MIEIEIPSEVRTLISQTDSHLARVRRDIRDADDFLLANEELAAIKNKERLLKGKMAWLLEPAKTAYERQRAQLAELFGPALDNLAAAKQGWDLAIVGWRAQQKQLAEEETRRREEAVEKERQRLREAAAAEAAKAAKRTEELRLKAEQMAASNKTAAAARTLEQADAREREAELRVNTLLHAADTMAAAPVKISIPKSSTGFSRKSWSATLAEKHEWTETEAAFGVNSAFEGLVVAIANGILQKTYYPSIALLTLNQSALNDQARALQEHFRLPFCRSAAKETTVSRTKGVKREIGGIP